MPAGALAGALAGAVAVFAGMRDFTTESTEDTEAEGGFNAEGAEEGERARRDRGEEVAVFAGISDSSWESGRGARMWAGVGSRLGLALDVWVRR